MTKGTDLATAARALSALGHEARLTVFRLLVRAGEDGLIVSDIRRHLQMPPSTLAHHLNALVRVGLVIQERRGSEIVNKPSFGILTETLVFLTEECCQGVSLAVKAA